MIFNQVSAQHMPLRKVRETNHLPIGARFEDSFTKTVCEVGLTFTSESKVVLEEFRKRSTHCRLLEGRKFWKSLSSFFFKRNMIYKVCL